MSAQREVYAIVPGPVFWHGRYIAEDGWNIVGRDRRREYSTTDRAWAEKICQKWNYLAAHPGICGNCGRPADHHGLWGSTYPEYQWVCFACACAEDDGCTDGVSAPPLEGLGIAVEALRRICRDDPEALALLEEVLR
jgi:hypothetical protein